MTKTKLPTIDFHHFLNLINTIYSNVIPTDFDTQVLHHNSLNTRLLESSNGKHALQQSSLLGHLESNGMMVQEATFIEFGCGSGEYSKYIQQAIEPEHVVLVDRKRIKLKVCLFFVITLFNHHKYTLKMADRESNLRH